jgi:hypothetical protein
MHYSFVQDFYRASKLYRNPGLNKEARQVPKAFVVLKAPITPEEIMQ